MQNTVASTCFTFNIYIFIILLIFNLKNNDSWIYIDTDIVLYSDISANIYYETRKIKLRTGKKTAVVKILLEPDLFDLPKEELSDDQVFQDIQNIEDYLTDEDGQKINIKLKSIQLKMWIQTIFWLFYC